MRIFPRSLRRIRAPVFASQLLFFLCLTDYLLNVIYLLMAKSCGLLPISSEYCTRIVDHGFAIRLFGTVGERYLAGNQPERTQAQALDDITPLPDRREILVAYDMVYASLNASSSPKAEPIVESLDLLRVGFTELSDKAEEMHAISTVMHNYIEAASTHVLRRFEKCNRLHQVIWAHLSPSSDCRSALRGHNRDLGFSFFKGATNRTVPILLEAARARTSIHMQLELNLHELEPRIELILRQRGWKDDETWSKGLSAWRAGVVPADRRAIEALKDANILAKEYLMEERKAIVRFQNEIELFIWGFLQFLEDSSMLVSELVEVSSRVVERIRLQAALL